MTLKTLVYRYLSVVLILMGTSSASAVPSGTWTDGDPTTSLSDSHLLGAATLLGNGKVVAAGGLSFGFSPTEVKTANLYDPSSNSWTTTGSLTTGRWSLDAVTLNNGKALFAGGSNAYFSLSSFTLTGGSALATAEVFDPVSNTFSPTGNNLSVGRHGYGISTLNDGRVLIAGGSSNQLSLNGTGITAVDIYDPISNMFTAVASLNAGRSLQAQTTLNNGKVVVVGGAQNDAEVYDPVADTWTTSNNTMTTTLKDMKAFELFNGKVFIASGQNTANGVTTDDTWFFDPSTLLFSPGPSMAGFNKAGGAVQVGTSDYSAFDLFEGTAMEGRYILFAGGEHDPAVGGDVELDSSSIYDAAQNMFFDAGDMPFIHDDHAESVLVTNGSGNPEVILLGGGQTGGTSRFEFDLASVIPEPCTALLLGTGLAGLLLRPRRGVFIR